MSTTIETAFEGANFALRAHAKLASVDSAPASPPEAANTSLPARIAWAIFILITLFVCYFSHLGAIGFVGPDEPRYAWIARDMAETRDWVTPRLYGKPWFEKPPLYYWCAALSFKLFGVSETAARLPSAVAALLTTLALAWLAWRVYGGETARWLLLLLPTSVAMIGFSHAASTDMLFSATLTLALVAAAAVLRLIPNAHWSSTSFAFSTSLTSLLFGLFLGLAVLAKGPAALVLLGGAVFFWAVFTERWRDTFRLFHPAALAAFFLTALPWYILCGRRNPDFFRIFIIEHNFKRYLTPEFQHVQPFWYYGAVLLIALLPWTALFLWSTISGTIRLWRTRDVGGATLLLLCWSAFCVLFFTISKSKLPGYVLPAIPVMSLLTARHILSAWRKKILDRLLFSSVGATLLLLGLLAYRFGDKMPFVADVRPSPAVTLFAAIMTVGGLVAAALALLRRSRACMIASVFSMVAWTMLGTAAFGELDEGISARRVVEVASDHLTPERIASATSYKLRRSFKYQVDYYLHRETAEWSSQSSRDSIIFTEHRNVRELEALGVRCVHYVASPAVVTCEDSRGASSLLTSSHGGQTQ